MINILKKIALFQVKTCQMHLLPQSHMTVKIPFSSFIYRVFSHFIYKHIYTVRLIMAFSGDLLPMR